MKSKSLSIVIYLLIGGGLFFYLNRTILTAKGEKQNQVILFIGKDDTIDSSRADALMLLGLDDEHNELSILSLPRDSLVNIPCSTSQDMDKIANSYSYGDIYWKNNGRGFSCTTQTVENLFSLKSIFTVEIEMKDLAEVIDRVGNIKVTPSISFCHDSHCFNRGVETTLDKNNLLAYVRHRQTFPNQDLTRIQNQQQVLLAFINKMASLSRLEQTKHALYFVGKLKSNYPKDKLLKLVDATKEKKITTATIAGKAIKNEDGYFYQLDKKDISYYIALYRNLLHEE